MPTFPLTSYTCPSCHALVRQESEIYFCPGCVRRYPIRSWGVSFLLNHSINQASQAEWKARNSEAQEYELQQVKLKGDSFIRLQGQLLRKILSDCPEGPILDAACGTGLMTQALAMTGRHVIAVDMSEASLEVLAGKKIPNVTIVHADITKLPFPGSSFGAITASLVIQHMEAELRLDALREFRRCLVPGGKIVVTAYARTHFHARKQPEEGVYESEIPYFSFSHDELMRLADAAELTEIAVRPLGLFLHLRAYHGGWRLYFNLHPVLNGFEKLLHRRLRANRAYRTDYWILEARKKR